MVSFTTAQVQKVSEYLQNHMRKKNIKTMKADDCAVLLANCGILSARPPKPGFMFRQMLRDGRDGKIPLVKGAYQARPHTRWRIDRV